MSQKPETFEELLDLWESPKELSAALEVPYVNAQQMKRRKSVGIAHWSKLIDLAGKRGVSITADDLIRMARKVAA